MTSSVDTPRTSARLDWIDAARAVSIALIVLMHARIVLGGVGVDAAAIAWVDDVAGHLRIPLFFAASGLFAARWATASWGSLFRGRLSLLMWVFLVWQPVVLAYKLIEWWLLRDVLAEHWGWQVTQFFLSPLRPVGELWFLWALVVFLVLTKLTARVPVVLRVGIPALASFAWTAFIEPNLGPVLPELLGAGWGGVIKYYVFFIAAATFSTSIRSFYSAMPRWVAALVFVGWLALTVGAIESGLDVRWVRFVLFALGAAAGFALGRLLAPLGPVRSLGRNTLPVYVAHLPLIVAVVVVIEGFGLVGIPAAAPLAAVFLLAAIAIAGALGLHAWLRRTRYGRFAYEAPAWFATLGARSSAA